MNKNYYLVKLDSYENYYKCTAVYKAESGKKLREFLEKTLASDMYIVSIEKVDYENHKKEILNQVSIENKMYSEYKEI